MDSQKTESASGQPIRPKRVLMVDDDDRLLELMAGWVRRAGHVVVPCTRFEIAKQLLAAERPDVLVTDVRLGAFNGLQLAVLSREQYPGMRVVVLTGFDDPVLRQQATTAGAAYLVKPVSVEQLLEGILAEPSPSKT